MKRSKYKLLDIDLRLFDGAAAGGAAPAAPAAGDGSAASAEQSVPEGAPKLRRKSKGGFSNVVFGKQTDPVPAPAGEGANISKISKAGIATTSDALEAKRKAYQDLIRGEYRDQYVEDTQRIVKERLRQVKDTQTALDAQKPIMEMLMQRYQVEDGDAGKLLKALERDTAWLEQAADEAGMSVEQYRQHQKWQRESAELAQIKKSQQSRQQADEQMIRWQQEEAATKEIYPGFDLKTELSNRDFLGLLRAGISMKQAYELQHMDELMSGAVRAAAQATEQRVTASVKSKAARPAENGTASKGGVVVKSDVSKLTRAERAEIARRVARGEDISF